MVGGSERRLARSASRRSLLSWGLFLGVVLALRFVAFGEEPPVAGADAVPVAAQQDGDPVATERFGWILGSADPLAAGEEAAQCLRVGPGCSPDGMLAVDTTAARAHGLAAALAAAADPASDGYLGEPSAATATLVEATRGAAAAVAEHLARWSSAGCGSTVDGVPVVGRPPECEELGARALAALDGLAAARADGAQEEDR
jgi:hypothetical protein